MYKNGQLRFLGFVVVTHMPTLPSRVFWWEHRLTSGGEMPVGGVCPGAWLIEVYISHGSVTHSAMV